MKHLIGGFFVGVMFALLLGRSQRNDEQDDEYATKCLVAMIICGVVFGGAAWVLLP